MTTQMESVISTQKMYNDNTGEMKYNPNDIVSCCCAAIIQCISQIPSCEYIVDETSVYDPLEVWHEVAVNSAPIIVNELSKVHTAGYDNVDKYLKILLEGIKITEHDPATVGGLEFWEAMFKCNKLIEIPEDVEPGTVLTEQWDAYNQVRSIGEIAYVTTQQILDEYIVKYATVSEDIVMLSNHWPLDNWYLNEFEEETGKKVLIENIHFKKVDF